MTSSSLQKIYPQPNLFEKILIAAYSRFSSYGYQKTSIGDIAKEAGVSRPTLYTHFKNKEAILQKVSEKIHENVITEIDRVLSSEAPLAERLEQSFEIWCEPFIEILESAHGHELIGAGSAVAENVSRDARQKFELLLTKTLNKAKRDEEVHLAPFHQSSRSIAEFLISALNGLSTMQKTSEKHKANIKLLVRMFLKIGSHESES